MTTLHDLMYIMRVLLLLSLLFLLCFKLLGFFYVWVYLFLLFIWYICHYKLSHPVIHTKYPCYCNYTIILHRFVMQSLLCVTLTDLTYLGALIERICGKLLAYVDLPLFLQYLMSICFTSQKIMFMQSSTLVLQWLLYQ